MISSRAGVDRVQVIPLTPTLITTQELVAMATEFLKKCVLIVGKHYYNTHTQKPVALEP